MAQLPSSFNSEEFDDMDQRTLVPKDDYHLLILDSDFKPNKKNTGHYLEVKFKIMAGDYEGNLLWARMNLDNPNKTAVDIANKELATLCRAVGKVAIDDSEELHGEELIGSVDIQKGNDGNPDSNVIKMYYPLDGEKPESSEKKTEDKKGGAGTGGKKRQPVFEDD